MPAPHWLEAIDPLIEAHRGFVVDLWGCLHDGQRAYPEAIAALARIKAAGRQVVLLSNAPRRREGVARRLAEMGVPATIYDQLYTSGEAARSWLAARPGLAVHHLGPQRAADADIRPGLPVRWVERIAEAELLLVTGPLDDDGAPDQHDGLLAEAAARGLTLLCANPDKVAPVGPRLALCAGTLAARYAGPVVRVGKPEGAVYDWCLDAMGGLAPALACGVGDGLETDIAGARAAGLSAVWIAGGIHAAALDATGLEPSAAAGQLLAQMETPPVPDWILPRLR